MHTDPDPTVDGVDTLTNGEWLQTTACSPKLRITC